MCIIIRIIRFIKYITIQVKSTPIVSRLKNSKREWIKTVKCSNIQFQEFKFKFLNIKTTLELINSFQEQIKLNLTGNDAVLR